MRLEDCPFDSQHYRLKIGRLITAPADGEGEIATAVQQARDGAYDVVFVRVTADDPMVAILESLGHTGVDTLVTSTLDPSRPAQTSAVPIELYERIAREADLEAIAAITRASITRSHLHADPRLPAEQTRALYAAWARNDATGRAQATLVARDHDTVVGYLSVVRHDGNAMIDLVAVSPNAQGRGIGSALLVAFRSLVERWQTQATVGTQVDNPALALYGRHGFVPTAKHITYHLWLR